MCIFAPISHEVDFLHKCRAANHRYDNSQLIVTNPISQDVITICRLSIHWGDVKFCFHFPNQHRVMDGQTYMVGIEFSSNFHGSEMVNADVPLRLCPITWDEGPVSGSVWWILGSKLTYWSSICGTPRIILVVYMWNATDNPRCLYVERHG